MLNTTGPISIGGSVVGESINLEFGFTATRTTDMASLYRGAGIVSGGAPNVPTSGLISLADFRGATNNVFVPPPAATLIQADQTNFNLRNYLISLGWDGTSLVSAVFTINAGVVISSNSTSIPGFTTGGNFPPGSDVTIVNNGYILGMGGQGGHGSTATLMNGTDKLGLPTTYYQFSAHGTSGLPGGTALAFNGSLDPLVSAKIKLTNNGIIGGGGGGGGGASSIVQPYGPDGGGGRSGRTNTVVPGVWGYAGSFAGAGPGLVPSGHGNSGAGGNWGAGGDAGWAWPGDYLVSYGGAGGAAITGLGGFTVLTVGTRYGAVS